MPSLLVRLTLFIAMVIVSVLMGHFAKTRDFDASALFLVLIAPYFWLLSPLYAVVDLISILALYVALRSERENVVVFSIAAVTVSWGYLSYSFS